MYSLNAQEIKKSQLLGMYTKRKVDPGRTIKQANGSEVSIVSVLHFMTTLKLKRFGKAKVVTKHFTNVIESNLKAKWAVKNDTLTITFKNGSIEGKYLMDNSREDKIYLHSVSSGRESYRQEYHWKFLFFKFAKRT